MDYDENSPETCASMTGKNLLNLHVPILMLSIKEFVISTLCLIFA